VATCRGISSESKAMTRSSRSRAGHRAADFRARDTRRIQRTSRGVRCS
jgi:hypothetical protein